MSKPARKHRTFSKASFKAYWERDVGTACEVAITLSDNDNYDSKKFLRAVARKLLRWAK